MNRYEYHQKHQIVIKMDGDLRYYFRCTTCATEGYITLSDIQRMVTLLKNRKLLI